jgi:glycosyltransferase involved in cell wall biosynthesis
VAFVAWLHEPADQGGHAGVDRYLYDVYLERADLKEAFPDLDGTDARRLIAWAWDHGRWELELAAELLPPLLASGEARAGDRRIAVNVAGYLDKSLGLGQGARLYIEALEAADVPVCTTEAPLQLPVTGSQEQALAHYGRHDFEHRQLPYTPPFNLLCVNPDGLPGLLEWAGPALQESRWTIAHWAWETDLLPPHWLGAFRLIDEVWVNSSYVAENLRRFSPVPVITIPAPVVSPDTGGARLDADLQAAFGDGVVFLFVFDFFSTPQRKNPAGLIEAFTRAFAPGMGPRLVLKAMNGSFRPEAVDELRWRIGDRPDIALIDRHVDRDTYAALLSRCDCYVSLHRAEGFGITLAEAMALAKPVIATGYSGNLDFMTADNSYLVDHTLTRVGPGVDMYPPEGCWAEPDLDHAARLMRLVWERPEAARATGERAARDVAESLSPRAAGALARARLEQLVAQSAATAQVTSPPAFAELDRTLALGPERSLYARHGGPARVIRRIVLRLIRPFTHHERELDAAIVEQLKRLDAEVASDRAAHVRDHARLRKLEARLSELADQGPGGAEVPSDGEQLSPRA